MQETKIFCCNDAELIRVKFKDLRFDLKIKPRNYNDQATKSVWWMPWH